MKKSAQIESPETPAQGARKRRKRKHGPTIVARFQPSFWVDADTRYAAIKLVRARVEALARDINADSEQKRLLVERAAFLSCVLESAEVRAAQGIEKLDLGAWTQGVNALTGLLKLLGIEKRTAQETLETYLAKRKREAPRIEVHREEHDE